MRRQSPDNTNRISKDMLKGVVYSLSRILTNWPDTLVRAISWPQVKQNHKKKNNILYVWTVNCSFIEIDIFTSKEIESDGFFLQNENKKLGYITAFNMISYCTYLRDPHFYQRKSFDNLCELNKQDVRWYLGWIAHQLFGWTNKAMENKRLHPVLDYELLLRYPTLWVGQKKFRRLQQNVFLWLKSGWRNPFIQNKMIYLFYNSNIQIE